MSGDDRRAQRQGTSPVSRTASGLPLAGIGIVAAAVMVIAVVALLAFRGDSGGGSGLGLGSGPPELSGNWDIAVTQAAGEDAGVGRISLTEVDDGLSGTGEVAFPDETMAMSLEGKVEEQDSGGQTINLASTDGSYQLRGTLGTDDSMEGSAVWADADSGGAFSAIRAGDTGDDSPRKAVSKYLRAWSYPDGTTDEEFLDYIGGSVVTPLYWSSPAGESSRQVAEDLSGSEEKMSMDLRLVEFVVSEENEAEVAGTVRYEQSYRAGEDRGTFSGAVPARVVRWGEGYRILSAGVEMLDPQAYLGGEYRVTTQNESEYFASESSDLIFGGEGFVMTLDSFSPDGDGSYDIEGTADGAVIGPAEVTGSASVADDGSLDVSLYLEAQRDSGGVHDLGLSGIELTDEGFAGNAVDNSTGAVTPPAADFVAVRERGKR